MEAAIKEQARAMAFNLVRNVAKILELKLAMALDRPSETNWSEIIDDIAVTFEILLEAKK